MNKPLVGVVGVLISLLICLGFYAWSSQKLITELEKTVIECGAEKLDANSELEKAKDEAIAWKVKYDAEAKKNAEHVCKVAECEKVTPTKRSGITMGFGRK